MVVPTFIHNQKIFLSASLLLYVLGFWSFVAWALKVQLRSNPCFCLVIFRTVVQTIFYLIVFCRPFYNLLSFVISSRFLRLASQALLSHDALLSSTAWPVRNVSRNHLLVLAGPAHLRDPNSNLCVKAFPRLVLHACALSLHA